MFSLIITIIAIALVAAIAIATIYYGGTVAQLAAASANASTLANQGAQIYAASLLFEQNMGRWPDTTDELVTNNYLTTVPLPPSSSYALNDSALVTDALAGNSTPVSSDWSWVTSGSRNIWVQGKINAPTCHAVNQKFGTGFDIGAGINTDVVIQCFGASAPYTFVYIAPLGSNGKTVCDELSESGNTTLQAIPCGAGPSAPSGGGTPPAATQSCQDLGTCPPSAPARSLTLNLDTFYIGGDGPSDVSGNSSTTYVCIVDPAGLAGQTITSVDFDGTVATGLTPGSDVPACVTVDIPAIGTGTTPAFNAVVTAHVTDTRGTSTPLAPYTVTGTAHYIPVATRVAANNAPDCNLATMSVGMGALVGGTAISGTGTGFQPTASVNFEMTNAFFTGTVTPPPPIQRSVTLTSSVSTAGTFAAPRALPALADLTSTDPTVLPWAGLPNIVGDFHSWQPVYQQAFVSCANSGGVSAFLNGSTPVNDPILYQYPMPVIWDTGIGDGAGGGVTTTSLPIYGSGFVPGNQSVYVGTRLATIAYASPAGDTIIVTPPVGAVAGDLVRVRVAGSNDSNGVPMPAPVTVTAPGGPLTPSGACWSADGCDVNLAASSVVDGSTGLGYAADNVLVGGVISVAIANFTDTQTVELISPSLTRLTAAGYSGGLGVPVSIRSGTMVLASGTLTYNPSPVVTSSSWQRLDTPAYNQDMYRLTVTGTNLAGVTLAVSSIPTPNGLARAWRDLVVGGPLPQPMFPSDWHASTGVEYSQRMVEDSGRGHLIYALTPVASSSTSYVVDFNMSLALSSFTNSTIRYSPPASACCGQTLFDQTYGMVLQAVGADAVGGYATVASLTDGHVTPPPLPTGISYTHPPIVDTPPAGGGGLQVLIGFGSDSVPAGGLPMGSSAPAACLGSATVADQNTCMAGIASTLMGGTCSVQMESGAGLGYSQTNIEVMYCRGVSQAGWDAARGSVESWYVTLYHTSAYP